MPAKAGGKSKVSTPAQKDRRSRSWTRGEKRKDANRKAQDERAAENRRRRAAGEPTPWEVACEARRIRRAAAGGKRS